MTEIQRRTKLGLMLLGSMLVLALVPIFGPATAQAEISTYCGGWLGNGQICNGASRMLYQVYGWGEHGSVCVAIVPEATGLSCSSGANIGVYSASLPYDLKLFPHIENWSGRNNFVHGLAGTH